MEKWCCHWYRDLLFVCVTEPNRAKLSWHGYELQCKRGIRDTIMTVAIAMGTWCTHWLHKAYPSIHKFLLIPVILFPGIMNGFVQQCCYMHAGLYMYMYVCAMYMFVAWVDYTHRDCVPKGQSKSSTSEEERRGRISSLWLSRVVFIVFWFRSPP